MPKLIPEETSKKSVDELLKTLRNQDGQKLLLARELVSSKKGREAITVGFIEGLTTPQTVHMLAIALRNTKEGCQLLADNPKVTDALLKKGSSDVAMVLIGVLKETPKGMERLLDNKPMLVDGDKKPSFVDDLLKYGKRIEVEAALGRIIKDHKLKETNNKKAAREEHNQELARLESAVQGIVTNGEKPLKKLKLPKPSKRVVSVGSGAGRDR